MKYLANCLPLLLILLLISCQSKESSKGGITDAQARDIILGYTQGMVKEKDMLTVRFKEGLIKNNSDLKSAIQISPSIDFEVSVDTKRNELNIKPSMPLARGMDYKITYQISQIIGQSKKQELVSLIKVFDQHINVQRKGLILDSNGNNFVELAVDCSLAESIPKIKSIFNYKSSNISVEAYSETEFQVLLQFYPEQSVKSVDWSGSKLQSKESGKIDIWSFEADEMAVVNTYFDRDANEYSVYFSQLLDKNQDAKGLILVGNEEASYDIRDNVLRIYLQSLVKEDVKLSIKPGIISKKGDKLKQTLNYDIEIDLVKPEIKWVDNAVYIPHTGEFKVPFKAKGLKAISLAIVSIKSENAAHYSSWNRLNYVDESEMIRFGKLVHQQDYDLGSLTSNSLDQWNEFGIDLTRSFQREKGSIYFIYMNYTPSQTILECKDGGLQEFESQSVQKEWFEVRNRYYNYHRYYDYDERNNPCKLSYYLNREPISKTIHCTNVFPIIKNGEREVHVAVKELLSDQLATNATVDLIDLQGELIASKTSAGNGVYSFNDMDRVVQAIKIKHEGEISFYPINKGDELSYTEFDVSSQVQDIDNRIFVYTERDVWRPGDTIFLDIMLNREKFHFEPDLPIVVKLYNPKNAIVGKYVLNINENKSIYSFPMKTSLQALTGYYNAKISIGPHKKSKRLRVETIRPNVVDLMFNFKGMEDSWVYNQKLEGDLNVNYLAGYATRNATVTTNANIATIRSPFKKYSKFVFGLEAIKSDKNVALFSVKTNTDGVANIKYQNSLKNYGGVSRVTLDTKIDLPGGGLNTETETIRCSPYESYVGIEKAKGRGWRGSYRYGEKPKINIVHVDKRGELKTSNSKLKVRLYKYEKDWWYDRYRLSNQYRHHNNYRLDKVMETEVVTQKGEYLYDHNTNTLESGMYKLEVQDPESGHISEFKFHSVTSQSYNVNSNPVFLNLNLEKDEYKIGETIKLQLPQIPDAKALISIELGNKVDDIFWMDISKGNTLELPVKESWFPNCYLNVSVVQKYGQEHNDRPLRMYTVQKIKVLPSGDQLTPIVNAPAKAEPNKSFDIQISESTGQPMEYTVALVDMGLLNLTGFRTPDPLAHFSKPMALAVKTWDIFAKLLYHMNPSFAGILSIGGDGVAEKVLDESADFNRFVPVVYHLGSIQLKANETKIHSISLPNYIGNLKLMLVATSGISHANAQQNIRVVSPLMVQSQMPRSLNITDKVNLPITIFKDEPSITNVQLSTTVDNQLVQFDQNAIQYNIGNDEQGLEEVQFEVGDEAGTTMLRIDASSNSFKAFEETKIFVNYPNSYSDKETSYSLDPGGTLDIDVDCFGFEKTRHVDLKICDALVPNFTKHYEDLIHYPHGCLEQVSSRGFSMLYIGDLMKMTSKETMDTRDYLDAAILKVQSYQKSDGRFSYWENGYYHPWADLYAGHFLIDAKEKSMLFNNDALSNWVGYHFKKANNWNEQGLENKYLVQREETIQAYRLFLLAKSGKPAKSAMNRFKNRTLENKMARMFLAGAYYFAGIESLAQDQFNIALNQGYSDKLNRYTFGSQVRNKAIAVYIMQLFMEGDKLDRYYEDWVKETNNRRWLSTQEMGFSFLASASYFGDNQGLGEDYDIEILSTQYQQREKHPSGTNIKFAWDTETLTDKAQLTNKGESKLYITKTERAISKDIYNESVSAGIQMSVRYEDTQTGSPINVDDIKQGQELTIKVALKNVDILDQENMALITKVPSGWELLNPRLYTTNELKQSSFIYQDFRDDRVYTYFNINKNSNKDYVFKAKASLKGDYYLPSVVCENMYDASIYSKSKSGRVKIK